MRRRRSASNRAVLAAIFLRRLHLSKCRIFIHEQNFAPGRWNRLVGRWVDRVWVSLEGSENFFPGCRVELTGYPIRRQIAPLDKAAARARLGLPAGARVVFVFGGSQGARTINRALVEALPALLADPAVEVFHGTGVSNSKLYAAVEDTAARVAALGLSEETLRRYHPKDFFHEIQYCYAAADLVVCRAGAGTLNEICRCRRPALVIPKSNLAGEHQVVWDGRNDHGDHVASGIYLYRITAGSFVSVKKMLMVR
jgi:UDP-N-acetylglucosamine--N-acetylmuramyl-(pentapeptide) pyrophosphoryl-undecaprenol N-acetylglucosamine transferase